MRNPIWAKYVRNKRKLRNLTRKQLAEMSNINASYVTLIERDGYVPRKDKVESLARALQVNEHECLLAAGYSDEHIAKVYRSASLSKGVSLAKPLQQQVKRMSDLPRTKQNAFAKTLASLLEVANG